MYHRPVDMYHRDGEGRDRPAHFLVASAAYADVNSGSLIATVSGSWSPCAMLSVRVGTLEKDVS